MKHSLVASRYARALADIAFDQKAQVDPDALASQLAAFIDETDASAELRTVFASPAVSHAKKRAVVGKIAERLGASRVLRNFLFVVIEHGRTSELKAIQQAFSTLIDKRRGVARADVIVPSELMGWEKEAIEKQIAAMTGKRVRSLYSVDPSLLGGVIVKIGSQVYDGSVRGRLNAIGAQLTAAV